MRPRIYLPSRSCNLPTPFQSRTYAIKSRKTTKKHDLSKPTRSPSITTSKAPEKEGSRPPNTQVPLPRAPPRPSTNTAFPYDQKNLAAKKLASRSSSTLLFLSTKSPWWQVVRVFGTGGLVCFLGDYLYHIVWLDDLGLPIWVKGLEVVSMGGIFGVLVYYSIFHSRGNIGSISANPVPGGLKMIIEGQRGPSLGPIRTWAPQRVECAISDVVQLKRNVLQNEVLSSIRERKELFEKQRLENSKTSPLKQLFGKATGQRFRETFLLEKNMAIQIKGTRWNMDVRDGWLLEQGRILQQLIKPDRERAG